tara:strand:+ start:2710 stop:3021 length:312 start_codon:yes stop_codon:yes gene_type:complete
MSARAVYTYTSNASKKMQGREAIFGESKLVEMRFFFSLLNFFFFFDQINFETFSEILKMKNKIYYQATPIHSLLATPPSDLPRKLCSISGASYYHTSASPPSY